MERLSKTNTGWCQAMVRQNSQKPIEQWLEQPKLRGLMQEDETRHIFENRICNTSLDMGRGEANPNSAC
jgi:hypothetical protein